MPGGSTLDPDNLPIGDGTAAADRRTTGVLGPSDSSDSGSDVSSGGALDPAVLGSDTDSSGTGEDAGAPGRGDGGVGRDLGFDRVVGRDEAGLGSGLDQAEEARAGVRDDDRLADSSADLDLDAQPVDGEGEPAGRLDVDELAEDAGGEVDELDDAADDELAGAPDDMADDGAGGSPRRAAPSAHGGGDDDGGSDTDEDDEADEADEADENEGEPPAPELEAPGPEQQHRPRVAPQR
jgi:hypothetical protein